MTAYAQLPSALVAAVVDELLYIDTRTAHAARVHRGPDSWRGLTVLRQLALAAAVLPVVAEPTLPKESSVPTDSDPCFARSSADRLRADLGPDEAVTDAEFDAAANDATALTRPVRAYSPRYTPTPNPRTTALRIVAGVIAAACVLGWILFEVVA